MLSWAMLPQTGTGRVKGYVMLHRHALPAQTVTNSKGQDSGAPIRLSISQFLSLNVSWRQFMTERRDPASSHGRPSHGGKNAAVRERISANAQRGRVD